MGAINIMLIELASVRARVCVRVDRWRNEKIYRPDCCKTCARHEEEEEEREKFSKSTLERERSR